MEKLTPPMEKLTPPMEKLTPPVEKLTYPRWKSSGAQPCCLHCLDKCSAELDRITRSNAACGAVHRIVSLWYLSIVGQGVQHLHPATRHAPRNK